MLKKTIRYTDYNGQDVQEDFYFNLTKAELVELEVSNAQGLAETLKAIVEAGDNQQIIENFKKIILMSYGEKSPDGRRFIKTQQLRDEFSQTEAYSELFIELATVPEAGTEFIKGVVPSGILQNEKVPVVETADIGSMTREELLKAYQEKIGGSQ